MSFNLFGDIFGTAKDIISLPLNVVRNPTNAFGTVGNSINSLTNTA